MSVVDRLCRFIERHEHENAPDHPDVAALMHVTRRALEPLASHRGSEVRGNAGEHEPEPGIARTVQQYVGGGLGIFNLLLELLNDGFALGTADMPQPSLPAATFMTPYLGPPHGHEHPPSAMPPAMVPIPLPSIGMVMIGMSLQVTMGGLPAARAGDIGLAMSCCGLVPLFSITTGSSKVFVGGMRAARASDIAQACAPGTPGMQAMATVMLGLGVIAQGAGAVADAQESADAPDANVAAALALSATMGAMQAAMDATSAAAGALMGTDPALPPLPGALLPSGASVMVAGMPTPNFPNPLEALIHAVRNRRARRRGENGGETHAGCHACP